MQWPHTLPVILEVKIVTLKEYFHYGCAARCDRYTCRNADSVSNFLYLSQRAAQRSCSGNRPEEERNVWLGRGEKRRDGKVRG